MTSSNRPPPPPRGRVRVDNGYEWAALFETLYERASWASEVRHERLHYYDDALFFTGDGWYRVHRETLKRYNNVIVERRHFERLAGPPEHLERALAKHAHLSSLAHTVATRRALVALEPSIVPLVFIERDERLLVIDGGGTVTFTRELCAHRNEHAELVYDRAYQYSIGVEPIAFIGSIVYELQRVRDGADEAIGAAELRAYMRCPRQLS